MTATRTSLAALAVFAAACFGGAAQAQYYYAQPDPLYPYVAQPQTAYPQPQYSQPAYPYVRTPHEQQKVPGVKHVPRAEAKKTDPDLVDELRKSRKKKEVVKVEHKDVTIDKKIVVREKPIVRKRIRVVDDPPIVVQREIDESQLQVAPVQHAAQPSRAEHPVAGRVIHAEAEVTIIGPDRMSIRLYRKQDAREANAKAPAAKPRKTKTSKADKSAPQT